MTDQGAPVSTPAILLLFVIFVCLIAGCGYAVVAIWPPDCVNNQCAAHAAHLLLWSLQLGRAENLLLLVAAMGALGALIHVTSSFADYVGNRRLMWSWVWWLLLRVPIGVALALVFYMLIRGGLIIPNGSTEPQINPYGIAGLAALIGMFAKQATDKLADIFDNLFRSDKDRARSDPPCATICGRFVPIATFDRFRSGKPGCQSDCRGRQLSSKSRRKIRSGKEARSLWPMFFPRQMLPQHIGL
jgi:hypothetical protein